MDASAKVKPHTAEAPAEKDGAPVGYGGMKVQMMPFMTPYRAGDGVRYEPLIVRLVLDIGEKQRSACFSVPYVHDRILSYLYEANLTIDDFSGDRRDLLQKKLFDVTVDMVGKGYYSGLEIVGPDAEELNPASQTLSVQCK